MLIHLWSGIGTTVNHYKTRIVLNFAFSFSFYWFSEGKKMVICYFQVSQTSDESSAMKAKFSMTRVPISHASSLVLRIGTFPHIIKEKCQPNSKIISKYENFAWTYLNMA